MKLYRNEQSPEVLKSSKLHTSTQRMNNSLEQKKQTKNIVDSTSSKILNNQLSLQGFTYGLGKSVQSQIQIKRSKKIDFNSKNANILQISSFEKQNQLTDKQQSVQENKKVSKSLVQYFDRSIEESFTKQIKSKLVKIDEANGLNKQEGSKKINPEKKQDECVVGVEIEQKQNLNNISLSSNNFSRYSQKRKLNKKQYRNIEVPISTLFFLCLLLLAIELNSNKTTSV